MIDLILVAMAITLVPMIVSIYVLEYLIEQKRKEFDDEQE